MLATAGVANAKPGFAGPSWMATSGLKQTTRSAAGEPTGTKPESKLWYHDGRWWAVLWDPGTRTGDYHIFWLDTVTKKWVDTNVAVDGRRSARVDVLSDRNRLYVAAHGFTGGSGGGPSLLYRYSYSMKKRKYSKNAGFPNPINSVKSETLVIEKDSANDLWATWTQNNGSGGRDVMVAHSGDNGATWPSVVNLGTVTADDISSIIAFGNRVGVMWNNGGFRFSVHDDGAGPGDWTTEDVPYSQDSDDHINLKAEGGRVYAAVKCDNCGDRLHLLVRQPGGAWSEHVVSRFAQRLTRPIVLLFNNQVHVYANGPRNAAGTIYRKTIPKATVADGGGEDFADGFGKAFIREGANTSLIDATSTKQNLNTKMGLVVLASSKGGNRYWANMNRPRNVIRGSNGNNRINGTRGDDVILGRGGRDRLNGGLGNDIIVGGGGKDTLLGGGGRDVLKAKDGQRDVLKGGPGRDRAQRDRKDVVRSIESFF
jgi:Ca2+-binding RTX toxin-like protein